MKKYSFLLIIGLAVLIILATIFVFPWIAIAIGVHTSPNPPEPNVKYGEFPFEIVYKINGETFTLNDIYVCEYDGIAIDEGSGKHRTWNGYVKSTEKRGAILLEDEERIIYCYVGDAETYMGDQDNGWQRPLTPYLYAKSKISNYDILSEEEILAKYNLEIISWSLSDPIENSFE